MSNIEITQTIKVQFKVSSSADATALSNTIEQYRQACQKVSQYVFDHEFELRQVKLHQVLYRPLREAFKLRSQMTQSVFRTVKARYDAIQTQMKKRPCRYQDDQGKWQQTPKDLTWLWQPVQFRRPQLDLVRGRDWSVKKDGNLSLNTLQGRIVVIPVPTDHWESYFDGPWKLGTAKVVRSGRKWYLHISVSKVVPDYDKAQTTHVVGIDRGLRFLTTVYDETGHTSFLDGQAILRTRRKFKHLRSELQSKGTKATKRKLQQLRQRENRWMTDINHRISQALVNRFGPQTLFVIEDLTNVRFATERVAKDRRYETVSWAFYQLEEFLTYKANAMGSHVLKVAANYTSQRCPKCTVIVKEQRHHESHEYQCQCGYRSNDDRIGAMNIQQLGYQWLAGQKHPKYHLRSAG